MQLGAEACFVGSGIFKSSDPARFAWAIVEATTHYRDAQIVAKVSRGLGDAMRGEDSRTVETRLADGAGSANAARCLRPSAFSPSKAMSVTMSAPSPSSVPFRPRCARRSTLLTSTH